MSSTDIKDFADSAIAIVGMAGRFPGAPNLRRYWSNLRDGVESIRDLADQELRDAGVPDATLHKPDYIKRSGVLENMAHFDAGFFGLSPRDAAIMDPQHRHFLECSWEALETAGHMPERFEGSIGVFAGSGTNAYLWKNLMTHPALLSDVGFFLLRHTGNDKDFLATRVSYDLDLRGPSVNVQTACSTSLMAIHLAGQSLLSGECDMALAGGVTIEHPHYVGYTYQEGEILSPDGRCRPFDADSQGTVFGSGCGVVVLRRLTDALEDGDTVHAVIRGTAANNDGSRKVSYLAPGVDGQAEAITEALAIAEVEADSIQFVETHGTGTPVGDPIEIAALTQAFRTTTDREGYCAIGSVKSNIGHTDTAAGIAGLIKTVLAMRHGQIPPTLHFNAPNPAIDFPRTPFFVNAELRDWERNGQARRAGVSSLGVGGTNVHVVLEEAPEAEPSSPSREAKLLVVSARSQQAAQRASADLADFLDQAASDVDLADAAYTLQTGRRAFEHRRAIVAHSSAEAAETLFAGDTERIVSGTADVKNRETAFLFAGGGAQYAAMGRGLYETESLFQEVVDECLTLVRPHMDHDLREYLFRSELIDDRDMSRPSIALPALFIIQYAQARLWMSWGIEPTAMVGHSMGEYTAACLADVFQLEDALALVALRGRLFERVAPGGMVSVPLSEHDLRARLTPDLSVAAVNGPELCVASGPKEGLAKLSESLEKDGVEYRHIHIDVAAHSSMLEPILADFRAHLQTISYGTPSRRFISNLSGTWITPEDAQDSEYWVNQLRHTVRFCDGLQTLLDTPDMALLEVGPGRTLSTLARIHPNRDNQQPVFSSLRHPDDETPDPDFMLRVLGALWCVGVEVDWEAFQGGATRRRTPLPTYPFEHEPHFFEPGIRVTTEHSGSTTDRLEDVGDWFSAPTWRPAALPRTIQPGSGQRAIVVARCEKVALSITAALETEGWSVGTVLYSEDTAWDEEVAALSNPAPTLVLHAGAVDLPSLSDRRPDHGHDQTEHFFSAFRLLRALDRAGAMDGKPRFLFGATGLHAVNSADLVDPDKSLLLGPARVLTGEFPGCVASVVDLDPSGWTAAEIVSEVQSLMDTGLPSSGTRGITAMVARRGTRRFIQSFDPLPLPASSTEPTPLVDGDSVVVITGGLGGIGLELAGVLVDSGCRNVALMSRSGLPPRTEWAGILDSGGALSTKITRVKELEVRDAQVAVVAADVTDYTSLETGLATVRETFGPITGVIHAAGALDDNLIALKTDSEASAVLAPKVQGTLNLDRALESDPLRFMYLMSSRSSVSGLLGQSDYSSANAFLDAFACQKSLVSPVHAVAVGWGAWRESGMAAELAGVSSKPTSGQTTSVDHVVFATRTTSSEGHTDYVGLVTRGEHWFLDEHKVADGEALIPGTGYLELVRAAHRLDQGDPTVTLEDVFFVSPCVIHEGEARDIAVRFTGQKFQVLSRLDEQHDWVEHARGTRASRGVGSTDSPPVLAINAIRARCTERIEEIGGLPHTRHLDFGPRWGSLQTLSFGSSEVLADLRLPDDFSGDLAQFPLHPALLDIATACGQPLADGFDDANDFFVPAGYGSVVVLAPLTTSLVSHVRLLPDEGLGPDVLMFDIDLADPTGQVLVEIRQFTMMRVSEDFRTATSDTATIPVDDDVPDWLRDGILNHEGAEVFRRLLSGRTPPHVLALPHRLGALLESESQVVPGSGTKTRDKTKPTIDVSEVEDALNAHEALIEGAAVGHQEGTSVRVVAFVVYDMEEDITVSELRRDLRSKLPEDLVPQNFVEMETLPRQADGDVDRSALPDPFAPVDTYVAPRTETESKIAHIWGNLLGVERVGIYDNFLDIGGHSLVGVRAILQIEKATGHRIHPNSLVIQTLEQIAAQCAPAEVASTADHNPPADSSEEGPDRLLIDSDPAAAPSQITLAAGNPESQIADVSESDVVGAEPQKDAEPQKEDGTLVKRGFFRAFRSGN